VAALDLAIVAAYVLGILGLGLALSRRGRESDRYMAAGRSLPGWAVGLAIFGSYVSSISYFANPGKAYAADWNFFVFSLAAIPAALLATRIFIPFYRKSGTVSAYEHLEQRFGPWARSYAVACFLLTQMARMGTIVYLLALALAPLTGWDVAAIVVGVGALMTVYTLFGGLEAAVLTGVVQSVVLIAGTAAVLVAVLADVPGGTAQVLAAGWQAGKFSLGGLSPNPAESSFWVVLLYGLTINLQNFGSDQGYIQRYVSARSEADARQSVWFVPLLYVPVAAVFFFVGTALYVLSRTAPLAPAADQVLPHFIAHALPAGVRGLVVASVLAAAMDSNLTSMATLTLVDLYRRYLRPNATERESLLVLRLSVLGWGALSTAVGVAMISAQTVLDRWWALAGVFSGGVLGLVLLGMLSRAGSSAAAAATAAGVAAILWVTFWKTPFHALLAAPLGTATILLVGLLAGRRP
jgi:SSS family solute:Na+ symporter